jgi:hypothetical protein
MEKAKTTKITFLKEKYVIEVAFSSEERTP